MTRYYYLLGTDGSGKSTLLQYIEEYFNKKDIKTSYVWLRFPMIISRPLMLFCRIVKLTKYYNINGIKYGAHEFYRSRFVSWIYPYLQFVDFIIKNRKFNNLNSVVLYDRYVIDVIADIMVDTHRFDFHKTKIGKRFLGYLPDNISILMLSVDEDVIRSRKKDTIFDPHLNDKIHVYKILAKDLNIELINNNGKINNTKKEIFNKMGFQ